MNEEKKKILIVDDDEILADELKDSLIDMGYDVLSIEKSGEDAINKIKVKMPDLVLMDIKLNGEKNGFETADEIINMQDIPIIFISGLPYEDRLYRTKLRVPYGYLTKPFTLNELQIVIESALTNWSLLSR